jgi:hypothetical protein
MRPFSAPDYFDKWYVIEGGDPTYESKEWFKIENSRLAALVEDREILLANAMTRLDQAQVLIMELENANRRMGSEKGGIDGAKLPRRTNGSH